MPATIPPEGKNKKPRHRNLGFLYGGDGRDRTDDLHTASVALSQLSYAPMSCDR